MRVRSLTGLGLRVLGLLIGASIVAIACTMRAPTRHGGSPATAIAADTTVPPMPTAVTPSAPANADSGYIAGSRLRPRWSTLVAADGARARAFAGFWDVVLKTECTFGLSSDGKQRCLPPRAEAGITAWFSDAACTRAMISAPAADCVGLVPGRTISLVAASHSICAAPPVVAAVRVGPQLAGTPIVHKRDGASCVAVGALVGNLRYFEAISIPIGDFVSATITTD